MPKDTFLNLSKEKQDIINKASMNEFSRVSFDEVSINQIIQNAGISRGSFYMYFEDKEDLYIHLIKTHHEKLSNSFHNIIEKNNGDLIKTYLNLFDFIIDQALKNNGEPIFKKMILNAGTKGEELFQSKSSSVRIWENHIDIIDFNLLNINSKDEIYDVIDILNAMLIHSLLLTLKGNKDRDYSYKKLEKQLFILRDGLYKQGGEN